MPRTAEDEAIAKDLEVSVEFTLAGSTDLDRFDDLLESFIEDELDEADETEFRDMILGVRRLDGLE